MLNPVPNSSKSSINAPYIIMTQTVRMREREMQTDRDRKVHGVIHQDGMHDVEGTEERKQVPF